MKFIKVWSSSLSQGHIPVDAVAKFTATQQRLLSVSRAAYFDRKSIHQGIVRTAKDSYPKSISSFKEFVKRGTLLIELLLASIVLVIYCLPVHNYDDTTLNIVLQLFEKEKKFASAWRLLDYLLRAKITNRNEDLQRILTTPSNGCNILQEVSRNVDPECVRDWTVSTIHNTRKRGGQLYFAGTVAEQCAALWAFRVLQTLYAQPDRKIGDKFTFLYLKNPSKVEFARQKTRHHKLGNKYADIEKNKTNEPIRQTNENNDNQPLEDDIRDKDAQNENNLIIRNQGLINFDSDNDDDDSPQNPELHTLDSDTPEEISSPIVGEGNADIVGHRHVQSEYPNMNSCAVSDSVAAVEVVTPYSPVVVHQESITDVEPPTQMDQENSNCNSSLVGHVEEQAEVLEHPIMNSCAPPDFMVAAEITLPIVGAGNQEINEQPEALEYPTINATVDVSVPIVGAGHQEIYEEPDVSEHPITNSAVDVAENAVTKLSIADLKRIIGRLDFIRKTKPEDMIEDLPALQPFINQNYTVIDVLGDGHCGYYVNLIGLIHLKKIDLSNYQRKSGFKLMILLREQLYEYLHNNADQIWDRGGGQGISSAFPDGVISQISLHYSTIYDDYINVIESTYKWNRTRNYRNLDDVTDDEQFDIQVHNFAIAACYGIRIVVHDGQIYNNTDNSTDDAEIIPSIDWTNRIFNGYNMEPENIVNICVIQTQTFTTLEEAATNYTPFPIVHTPHIPTIEIVQLRRDGVFGHYNFVTKDYIPPNRIGKQILRQEQWFDNFQEQPPETQVVVLEGGNFPQPDTSDIAQALQEDTEEVPFNAGTQGRLDEEVVPASSALATTTECSHTEDNSHVLRTTEEANLPSQLDTPDIAQTQPQHTQQVQFNTGTQGRRDEEVDPASTVLAAITMECSHTEDNSHVLRRTEGEICRNQECRKLHMNNNKKLRKEKQLFLTMNPRLYAA